MMDAVFFFALLSAASAFRLSERDEFHFKSWMAEYNRVYSSMEEYYKRLQIFTDNKRMIDKHNEGNHSYTLGLNQFADMTDAEFQKYHRCYGSQICSSSVRLDGKR